MGGLASRGGNGDMSMASLFSLRGPPLGQKIVQWYHARYIATSSFSPIYHSMGAGFITGNILKYHFNKRAFDYEVSVKMMEGCSKEDAEVAAATVSCTITKRP